MRTYSARKFNDVHAGLSRDCSSTYFATYRIDRRVDSPYVSNNEVSLEVILVLPAPRFILTDGGHIAKVFSVRQSPVNINSLFTPH
jgi:hypothetical protein